MKIIKNGLKNDRIFPATRIQRIQGPQDLMTTIGRTHRDLKGERDSGSRLQLRRFQNYEFLSANTVKWMFQEDTSEGSTQDFRY
ncbi:hypothetical protein B9Z55_008661 [Caenorhabditis nigoni]|nr:hypothetical protein B9Z55_008661 [Caenorhabditis nigoni]